LVGSIIIQHENIEMVEARLLEELNQSKMEVARLRERLSVGTPTVYKDLSLISLVLKW
jgi:hypothetical protein